MPGLFASAEFGSSRLGSCKELCTPARAFEPDCREALCGSASVDRVQGRHEESGRQLGLDERFEPKPRQCFPDPKLAAMDPLRQAVRKRTSRRYAQQERRNREAGASPTKEFSLSILPVCGRGNVNSIQGRVAIRERAAQYAYLFPGASGSQARGMLPTIGPAPRALCAPDPATRNASDASASGRPSEDVGPRSITRLRVKFGSVRGNGFDKHRHAFGTGDSHGLASFDGR